MSTRDRILWCLDILNSAGMSLLFPRRRDVEEE